MNEIKIKVEKDEIERKHTTEKFNKMQSYLLFLNNKIDYYLEIGDRPDQVFFKKKEREKINFTKIRNKSEMSL